MLGSFTGREFASFDLRRKEMHYPSFAIFIAEKSWVPSPACAQGPIKRISTSPKILLKRIKIAWPFNIFLHTADGRPPNYLIKPDHLQHQNKNLMQWSSNFEDLPTLRITGLELIPQRTSLVWSWPFCLEIQKLRITVFSAIFDPLISGLNRAVSLNLQIWIQDSQRKKRNQLIRLQLFPHLRKSKSLGGKHPNKVFC